MGEYILGNGKAGEGILKVVKIYWEMEKVYWGLGEPEKIYWRLGELEKVYWRARRVGKCILGKLEKAY